MSSARKHRTYFLLQRAAHVVKKAADRETLRTAGVTTAQAAVLNLVAENPSISQRRLATLLEQNESAMTAMISRLVDAGLVRKQRDESDARAFTIGLTARGRKKRAAAQRAFGAINGVLDEAIGEKRMELLADDLGALIEGIGRRLEAGKTGPKT